MAMSHAVPLPFFFHLKRMFPKIRFVLEQENPRLVLIGDPYIGGKAFFQYYTNAIQLLISRETMAFHTSRKYKYVLCLLLACFSSGFSQSPFFIVLSFVSYAPFGIFLVFYISSFHA